MSNPESIIRPPVLNTSIPPPSNPQVTPELSNIIRNIVTQVILTDAPALIENIIQPRRETVTDQTIDPRYAGNLSGLDRVPDVVRCLRDFSGDPKEFASWKKSVERILRLYESEKGTPRYFGILNVIRNKITGNADVALESYNTPLNWEAISKCLNTHYADQRDISTLEYQMSSLFQGNKSINEFYHEVFSHLSLILNKIACLDIGQESLNILTKTYRDKALDTFVRGLNGELPKLLGIKEPTDLPQALQLCMKLQNQNFRTQHAFNNQPISRKPIPPPLPLRKQQYQKQPFYPNLAYIPQPIHRVQNLVQPAAFRNIQYQNPHYPQYQNNFVNPQYKNMSAYPSRQLPRPNQFNYPPPRPTQPKPSVPMEIDESQQTRNINYMNRPNFNGIAGKRPSPPSNQLSNNYPNKFQRINYIAQDANENSKNYEEDTTQYEEIQPWDEYKNEYMRKEQDNPENNFNDFVDVHFLD